MSLALLPLCHILLGGSSLGLQTPSSPQTRPMVETGVYKLNSFAITGFEADAGDMVEVSASGTITLGPLAGTAGPGGKSYGTSYNIAKNANHGVLMAVVGGDWFVVGASRSFAAKRAGAVWLRINDNDSWNNSGALTVRVTVRHKAKKVKPKDPPAGVELTQATTKDAQSVTVSYKITGKVPVPSFGLKVYRSSKPTVDDPSTAVYLGEGIMSDPKFLEPENDYTATLLQGQDLPPDPEHPYVVVVANVGDRKSTTYFRKWRLATVTHGFAGKILFDHTKTMAWTNQMASSLKSVNRFDEAIALDWTENSILAIPRQTQLAGLRLATQIQEYRVRKGKEHAGDVVDVHLVGHSRGTVVTSQALLELVKSGPMGSYLGVTLLDPHPANPAANDLQDHGSDALSKKLYEEYVAFQAAAVDPEIVIPSKVGIRSIEVWSQHTPAMTIEFGLVRQSLFNAWGQGEFFHNRIQNNSGVSIRWRDLTSRETETGSSRSVGHGEVHEVYQREVVSQGLVR